MNESVQEFLEDKGYRIEESVWSSGFDVSWLMRDYYQSEDLKDLRSAFIFALEQYLEQNLSIHWQLFGGVIPFAQYLDASVVKDIQQALAYWQALNDK